MCEQFTLTDIAQDCVLVLKRITLMRTAGRCKELQKHRCCQQLSRNAFMRLCHTGNDMRRWRTCWNWILGLNALGLRSRIISIAWLRAVSLLVLFMQLTQLQPWQYLPDAKHSQ